MANYTQDELNYEKQFRKSVKALARLVKKFETVKVTSNGDTEYNAFFKKYNTVTVSDACRFTPTVLREVIFLEMDEIVKAARSEYDRTLTSWKAYRAYVGDSGTTSSDSGLIDGYDKELKIMRLQNDRGY